MSLTYTPPTQNTLTLPPFSLPGLDGKLYSSTDYLNKSVAVFFMCKHCPYVQAIEERVITLAKSYKNTPHINFIFICSNDANDYLEDSFNALKTHWDSKGHPFPYLYDESQKIAKAFGAVCTPDIFLFQPNHQLVYRGRLDDNWKSPQKVQKQELKDAIECVLQKKPLPQEVFPAMGCSIKWKTL